MQTFNMLNIRSKMECHASGDKNNLVIINDALIKMGQKSSSFLVVITTIYKHFLFVFFLN